MTVRVRNQEAVRAYARSYRARPEVAFKDRARVAVYAALKAGHLVRPERCEVCKRRPSRLRDGRSGLRADHHLGYDEAHWLDVRWVCVRCDVRASTHARLTSADPVVRLRALMARSDARCECGGECGQTHEGGWCRARHGVTIARLKTDLRRWRRSRHLSETTAKYWQKEVVCLSPVTVDGGEILACQFCRGEAS